MAGWHRRFWKEPDLEDFNESKAIAGKYTAREMERYADGLLKNEAQAIDPDTGKKRGWKGENQVLTEDHLYARRRREIIVESGTPDPSLVSGFYWRQCEGGRAVNSPEARANGSSYFK